MMAWANVSPICYNAALRFVELLKTEPSLMERFVAFSTNRERFQRYDDKNRPIWTTFADTMSSEHQCKYDEFVEIVKQEYPDPFKNNFAPIAIAILLGQDIELKTGEVMKHA